MFSTLKDLNTEALKQGKNIRYGIVTLKTPIGDVKVTYHLRHGTNMQHYGFRYELDGTRVKSRDLELLLAGRQIAVNPIIAKAVEPLRIPAIAHAEEQARKFASGIAKQIKEHKGDLDKIAPYGDPEKDHENLRRLKDQLRATYNSLTEPVGKEPDLYKKDTRPVRISKKKVEAYVNFEKTNTSESFDDYVLKLSHKVAGQIVSATIVDNSYPGSLWQRSILSITFADKSVQRWQTQIIMNCSVYGKLFNQWPTRLLTST